MTTPMTFVATANACLYSNIDFDLVDIDSKTLNIDTNKLKYFQLKIIIKKQKLLYLFIMVDLHVIWRKYIKWKDNKSYVIEDASRQ